MTITPEAVAIEQQIARNAVYDTDQKPIGSFVQPLLDKIAQYEMDTGLDATCKKLMKERDELADWKAQQMAVESEWDAQAIAKQLGATLGQSCRRVIGEKVPMIIAERNSLLSQKDQLEKTVLTLRGALNNSKTVVSMLAWNGDVKMPKDLDASAHESVKESESALSTYNQETK